MLWPVIVFVRMIVFVGQLLPAQQSYMRACKVFEEHEKRTAYKLDKKVSLLNGGRNVHPRLPLKL